MVHYEFMQDYQVHLKHEDGSFEKVPYFCLPANKLKDVIAPSCYSCFDYVNGLADLVVGYMGVPYYHTDMTRHPQYVTVRNNRGKEMFDLIRDECEVTPSVSSGERKPFVMQTVVSDDEADARTRTGGARAAPGGKALAWALEKVGPKGKEFGMYSSTTTPSATFCTSSDTSDRTRARINTCPSTRAAWWTSTTSTARWTSD